MKVIGLTGLAGSGKTTVANYLADKHGYSKLSFDGPVRKMLRTLNPILGVDTAGEPVPLDDLDALGWTETDLENARYGAEYRRLLAALAATHPPEYWVELATQELTDDEGQYVFDDISNQLQADVIRDINKWGLWHIDRPAQDAPEPSVRWLGEVQTLFNVTTKEFLYSEADRALRLAFSDTAPLAA